MKADRKKLELAMARACMNSADLPAAAGLPRPTVQNVIVGKSVRPATLGKVARALGVDPEQILEKGE
ncbi:helix-turn-helix domain-containing protein [Acutalibacter muris]|uniref:helix-turn-helix domain-containing protein n=1 Tax=Acutalibacter muris TaxID=1796620 RepID=UPI001C3ED965|nr:helix-turn-helix transcriptional regulator [Acutalibacter muris]